MTYNELDRELFDEGEVPLVKADAFQGKIQAYQVQLKRLRKI